MARDSLNSNSAHSRRTLLTSLAALGSAIAASSCCLPLAPFLAAGTALGSSLFFVKVRPFLLVASVLFVAFGFYQLRRARQCQLHPSTLSRVLLWFSTIFVLVLILFPQFIANLLADVLAR